MSNNPLDKVIELIKKTGDNCIIVDSAGNPNYVVMDFGKYQRMHQGNHHVDRYDALEDAIEEAENAPKVVESDQTGDPFVEQESLNEAENKADSDKSEEKYYFEPID